MFQNANLLIPIMLPNFPKLKNVPFKKRLQRGWNFNVPKSVNMKKA